MAANTAAVAELRETKAEIDDSAVGADGWSSKHIVDMLCPKIEESGNPVQCYPVAGYPLGVTASWEPVQEGEGEPYPAGGGKNLLNFPENTVLKGTGDTELEFPFDLNGDYVFSFKGNVKVVEIGSALWMFEIDGVQKYIVADSGMESLALSGHITKVALTNWGKCTGTILWAQLEKGSTPTAYAPYENIRPIKGRDSVTVNLASGVKAWKLLTLDGTEAWITPSANNYYAFFGNPVASIPAYGYCSHYPYANDSSRKCVFANANGAIVFYGHNADYTLAEFKAYLAAQYAAGTPVQVAYKLATAPIVPEDGGIYFAEQPAQSGSGDPSPTNIRPILLDGAVKDGGTNVLTLPETVYGGEVDAVSGSGERVRQMLPLDGTENWFTWGVNANNAAVTGFFTYDIADYKVENEKGICSHLPHPSGDTWGGRNEGIGFASVGSSRYLMCCVKTKILDDVSSDANAITSWKAYLAAQYAAGTPVQVCYKLATPVPFTATGAQPLPALAGANTVITDADSVAVTGRADPIKRIEDLEAAVASIN